MQKHRIYTNIGRDQKINVEINQDFDIMEVLSLKFTQKDVFASGRCSEYGVVVGRISANNGCGIPNARVSIFIPEDELDEDDPVIHSLYPYKDIGDKNENNYRYNLLPERQQHPGHTATGTFFDQKDILTREEVLEVFEKYYSYTVKTNSAGDFMIWGVPIGTQILHVDIDLSDIGCFSLRPNDFLNKGYGIEQFENYYKFKASSDIDSLPQIVSFDKSIEVYPFWGNEELCEIGITRTDFDLSERDIKIEPKAIILFSSVTDEASHAVKRNGKIRRNSGYKCNLQTSEGKIECVRFTGRTVLGTDGITEYPELEYFNPTETINEDGVSMIAFPMNIDYVYTNELGEQEITNDPNKGIPTGAVARFRFSLDFQSNKVTTAKYLVPNIREFTHSSGGNALGYSDKSEYQESLLATYQFSDVFEDYLTITPPSTDMVMFSQNYGDEVKEHKRDLILSGSTAPQDYFYRFIYGKVYAVSSFQGTHHETRVRDAFLGIKEIRPNIENDCASSANYLPTNFAFKNRIKFNIIISQVLLFLQYIFSIITIKFAEILGKILYDVGRILYGLRLLGLRRAGQRLQDLAYRTQEKYTKELPLTIYPDCEECTNDNETLTNEGLSFDDACRVAEVALTVDHFAIMEDLNFFIRDADQSRRFSTDTTIGSTFLDFLFPGDVARQSTDKCAETVPLLYSTLDTLHLEPLLSDGRPRYGIEVVFSGQTPFFDPFVTYLQEQGSLEHDAFYFQYDTNVYDGWPGYKVSISWGSWNSYLEGGDFGFIEPEVMESFYGGTIVIRIYDRTFSVNDGAVYSGMTIEEGCQKYDKMYNEDLVLSYIWATGTTIPYDSSAPIDPSATLGPYFGDPGFAEVLRGNELATHPYLISSVVGTITTRRLPIQVDFPDGGVFSGIGLQYYERKTKSGLTELRDGLFTIIPVIDGRSYNLKVLQEWYKRKRVGLSFCGGVVNYSFIDNWLHGVLYFFKFDKRIRWDTEADYDLNQRGSRYPRELVFYNIIDKNFYYRSTPYTLEDGFIGQSYDGKKEILHPTTFYDLGIRDEFLGSICTDIRTDPACSVIRDITTTSYQDPANVVEYAINYRLDTTRSKFDVDDFFSKRHLGSNIKVFDGDITQLMSINCEAGIEAFDLDSPHYYMYNGEYMDPEDDYFDDYFKAGILYGPTPIDLKLDFNGVYMRLCLNYRLGDYSQVVPFYLWEKEGTGFGPYGVNSDDQRWDKTRVAAMTLQRMFSISGVTETSVYDPVFDRVGRTNYLMPDGEEEFILKPMTMNHRTFSITGDTVDSLERFEIITRYPDVPVDFPDATQYVEGDLWLQVLTYDALITDGYRKDPWIGVIYVVVNKTWVQQPDLYVGDTTPEDQRLGLEIRETFVPQTAMNYWGENNDAKQVLSTPFLFYFGLKPGRTSIDLLIKYYGPKDVFSSEEEIICAVSDADVNPPPVPPVITFYFRLTNCINGGLNYYGEGESFLPVGTAVWGSVICDINQAYVVTEFTINESDYIGLGYQNVGIVTRSNYPACYDCNGLPIGGTPTPTPTPVWYFRLNRCIDNNSNFYAKSISVGYFNSGDAVWGSVECDPNSAFVVIGSTLNESEYIDAGYQNLDSVSLSEFGACKDCEGNDIVVPPGPPMWTAINFVRDESNVGQEASSTCGRSFLYDDYRIETGYIEGNELPIPFTGGYTVYAQQDWGNYFEPSGLRWGIQFGDDTTIRYTVYVGANGPGIISDWTECPPPPDAPERLINDINIFNTNLDWVGYTVDDTIKTYTTFQNNYIRSVNTSMYILNAGEDVKSVRNNNLDNILIVGNNLNWEGMQTGDIITHGLFCGYNINQTIKWNFLQNCPYGIIFKSGGYAEPNMNITSGGVSYNIVRGGRFSARCKGINGARFYNNTFYGNAGTTFGLIMITENPDGEPTYPGEGSINTKVKNNILYTTNKTASINIDTASRVGFECDYNLYWCEAGDHTPVFTVDGSSYTWAQWRALGYDAHSVVANPNFNGVILGSQFAPSSKTIIQVGTNLGADFAWGLQTTANWVVGQNPAIRYQGTSSVWQVGAKIFA